MASATGNSSEGSSTPTRCASAWRTAWPISGDLADRSRRTAVLDELTSEIDALCKTDNRPACGAFAGTSADTGRTVLRRRRCGGPPVQRSRAVADRRGPTIGCGRRRRTARAAAGLGTGNQHIAAGRQLHGRRRHRSLHSVNHHRDEHLRQCLPADRSDTESARSHRRHALRDRPHPSPSVARRRTGRRIAVLRVPPRRSRLPWPNTS